MEIVLNGSGQIGVAGTRPRNRFLLILPACSIFHGQGFGPILPIGVANDNGDRRSDGLGVPDARDDFCPVRLDLHAPAAAVALLTAPELVIDGVKRNGNPGRETGERSYQALAVGLARGFKSKHAKELMLAGRRGKRRIVRTFGRPMRMME